MLLGTTVRMVYLKCVTCNEKLVKIAFQLKNAETRFIGLLLISPTKSPFL